MGTRRTKTRSRTAQDPGGIVLPPAAMEKPMRDVQRLLEEREFENIEEANAFLARLVGSSLEDALNEIDTPLSPREEAQELAWDAMEAPTAKRARQLAKQALAKDPDCVDALIALTEAEATSTEQAIAGMRKAVAAGERSLGAAFFEENKGSFWGLLETRPYMRARHELAELLLEAGQHTEAMEHLEALLALNPNDNQGVRDVLLGCYLAQGSLEGSGRLLRDYKNDCGAVFSWGRVLHSFLSHDVDAARRALKKARKENRFVELYLTGELPPPKDLPDFYSFGSKEEAVVCLITLCEALASHPEAMMWIWQEAGVLPSTIDPPQGKLF